MKTSVHSATAKQLGYVLQVTCVMIFTVCEIITSLIFSYGRVPSKATFERKCKVRKKFFFDALQNSKERCDICCIT